MIFLEILFIVSLIELLITWIWFIILGFRANKVWGFSIVFLFPIMPFIFSLRFARKARKAIYYYVIALVVFVSLNTYIFYGNVTFYENIWQKITILATQVTAVEIEPSFDFNGIFEHYVTEAPAPERKVQRLVARPIKVKKKVYQAPVKHAEPKPSSYYKKPTPKKPAYQIISIGVLAYYFNKKIIITTSVVQHKGRLISVTASTVFIKKHVSGGFVSMAIKKNKIKQIKIYL
ncbi:MAG: hypothetical protein KAU26_06850 [Methylococcales bacterium]|nr:hypothetical protein [Methylococcales bacterium]